MNGKVCASCYIELYPKQNGVWVIEHASFGPYKLWNADLWGCRGCNANIVLGFAPNPVREHFQPDFDSFVDALRKEGNTIIDCYEHLPEVAGK